ncbi:MAG: imidazole glycerol phosphate synthase subunit HisH, partial [Micavibrio aeruginosavorus]
IDYGAGNLHSVHNALRKAGADDVTITADADVVARADRIVLPGVGAFRACRDALVAIPGMVDAMNEAVNQRGVPFLGVCVGMQLLASRGLEFGEHEGLGWIAGDVRKINTGDEILKIPHMGWNGLQLPQGDIHPVLQSVTKKSDGALPDFYFVHSFVFDCKDTKHVAAFCDYGENFAAIVAKDNMIGCQFHPEKSQQAGLDLIRGFIRWKP